VIACSIDKQQDVLRGKLFRQGVKKDLETFDVRGRHDQVAASSILWADPSIEVGEFANELGRNFRHYPCWGPAWPRTVDPTEPRFVGKHDP
jgi:hypothetical protein